MGVQASSSVDIVDFPGYMQNADPRDYPQGAAELQVNATCLHVGELAVRGGMREVSFESTTD